MAVEADNIQVAMSDEMSPAAPDESVVQSAQHVILFYKYHPLSSDPAVTKIYSDHLEQLCSSLTLSGRILVGASRSEGINGNLAGSYMSVRAFTYALLGDADNLSKECDAESKHAVDKFWGQTKQFFLVIGEQDLRMSSPDDFKWSCSSQVEPLFPDLNIKVVPELIGTGGVLSSIPLEETAKGYLTPMEWHKELSGLSQSSTDTILIDCRNTKEYTIGRFTGATDPQTTTFSQFPKWVDDHNQLLADKKVLMYCTGGIRCEKVRSWAIKLIYIRLRLLIVALP
jgi:predicted sulfurtransferase